MSSFAKAIDDIKTIAEKSKPYQELAEILEKIGSLDNAHKESLERHAKASADADIACQTLAKKHEEIKTAHVELVALREEGRAILADAQESADIVIANSNTKCRDQEAAHKVRHAQVLDEVKRAQATLEQLKQAIGEAELEFASTKNKHAEFKKKILSA